MAEYIDRERLKEDFDKNIVSANVFNNIIDSQPPADVIERTEYNRTLKQIAYLCKRYDKQVTEYINLCSKINEAIEKIRNLKIDGVDDDFYDCKYEVLKILENIYIQTEKVNKNEKRS